ncbi:MAG TPA: late competence development ComFB family protein [Erysipelotrichaceae bacterium]|nr:late competence development ComFB family protein [Erysipelotrichaceae bacterium]
MSNNRAIDKEAMYKKIMPSAAQKERVSEMSEETPPSTNTPKVSYFQPKILVNLAELAVKERLNEALDRFKCCECDRCIKDILAIAVNTLPPKYIVRSEQDIAIELRKYEGDVVGALVNAVITVKNNPRH